MYVAFIRTLVFALALFPALANAQLAGGLIFPGPGTPAATGHAMVTPLFVDSSAVGPSNSATNYTGIQGGGWTATQANRQGPVATAGSIANLNVRFPTATGAGLTYDICMVLNGSATCTALTCQITNAALTCADAIHSVAVVAGDLVAWKVVPTGTPAASSLVQISATFTSTANGESVVTLPNISGAANTAPFYLSFGFPASGGWRATETDASGIMPTGGVLDKLYINQNTGPGAAKTQIFSVFKNGTNTGITCTLTGSGTGAGASTCNDTTHTTSVVATDLISLEMCPGTVSGGVCTALSTAAIGNMTAGLRWVPTTPGEAIMTAVQPNALSTSVTVFLPFAGSSSNTTESSAFAVAPSVFTVKNLYAAENTAPGGSANRAITLRKGTGGGQADQAVTCTITSAATACNDTTHSFATTLNDFINWKEVPTTTPAAITYFKNSAVLYTP